MKKTVAMFDFNGTLFWDSEINYLSWDICIRRWFSHPYSRREYAELNGRTNPETITTLFKRDMDAETMAKYSDEKRKVYFDMLEKNKNNISLAPGLEELLTSLKNDGVILAIATSACPSSMEKYEHYLNLSRYFKKENIFANDGSLASKPNPAIFRKAIKGLNVAPQACVIFEDTRSGIISAQRSGVDTVVAVRSPGCSADIPEVTLSITNFNCDDIFALFQ